MSSAPITPGAGAPPVGTGLRVPAWVRTFRPGLTLAWLIVGFFLVAAAVPSLLTTYSPLDIDLPNSLHGPSLTHLFGTDQSGRDLYTRVVYGARDSLEIGFASTAVSMGIAILLGVSAGLSGKRIDGLINRVIEVLFSFPVLLLALLFVTVFGAGKLTLIVAVGIGTAPGYARMVRGQVLAVKGAGYVEAAGALGHSFPKVIRRHIFPNAMRPLVVVVTLGIGQSIVWASGIAFLGLGVAPPAPEWGALLDAGRNYVAQASWLELFPGLAIVGFALAVTAIGRNLQQRLEGANQR